MDRRDFVYSTVMSSARGVGFSRNGAVLSELASPSSTVYNKQLTGTTLKIYS
ncbi:hypothetical protein [Pedobacter zeae]|uniref:Uncharacterized protein n=1 Tax=Pedobacter zeae TaxID=1737356 RepID=A0A7W6K9P0_9SPHI|nr:hypothetical protein [Pedobacter zeae]MBB4107667.1 hypothetical protein [Pedobacter zeae]